MTAARSSLFLSRTESTPSFRWLSATRSKFSGPGTHSTDGWIMGPHRDHRAPVLARIEATTGTIAGISIYLAGEEGQ